MRRLKFCIWLVLSCRVIRLFKASLLVTLLVKSCSPGSPRVVIFAVVDASISISFDVVGGDVEFDCISS